jgi:riboflavin synthase
VGDSLLQNRKFIGYLSMFTGIVRDRYQVTSVERLEAFCRVEISLDKDLLFNLERGSSVSVDGVCLTVTALTETSASFDIMQETLRVTTLNDIAIGRMVNIEPSLSTQRDISGHIVSGHVDTTATITALEQPDENNCTVTFAIDPRWMRYIFQKGYLAINGCSLTVGVVDKKSGQFSVYLIPETIRRTTFEFLKVGDRVNIEVERQTQVIVDTIWASMEDFKEQFAEELRQELGFQAKN